MRHVAGLAVACLLSASAIDAQPPSTFRAPIDAYRRDHEAEILRELRDLLAIPNLASDSVNIRRNAQAVVAMLQRRGVTTQLLESPSGGPPAVFGELRTAGATRTIVLYAHYDGQPVEPARWATPPWEPTLRDGPLERGGNAVPLPSAPGATGSEWRIYARSASDDKSPIVAILTALDALRASGLQPSVNNLKLFLEGEEEQGSEHLTTILRQNVDKLAADAWILCDGPVHPSRRMQIYFGARGVAGLEITAYGPVRPLHSGHYGNWAPNPAVELAHLIAQMRDEEGRILIPGFYDDVRPLTVAEKQAIAVMPLVEASLEDELGLGRTEGKGARLQDRLMDPALNVRGLRSAEVGEAAANAIPTEAQASIDFRLVPDQTPRKVKDKVEAFLRAKGWHLVEEAPDKETLRAFPKVARVSWSLDYAAHRTDMSLPVSKAVIAAAETAAGGPVVQVPMLGGSVPMALFTETLKVPMIGVPMVNHDNNQHGINENLRLRNLWDGIEVYAEMMADLGMG
jgi:acetylornithine deacetylase/succinyl-diaminopimelate desuccinylase-like protein